MTAKLIEEAREFHGYLTALSQLAAKPSGAATLCRLDDLIKELADALEAAFSTAPAESYETLSQAGRRLGKSVPTVRRWIDEGKLRAMRPTPDSDRYALSADVDRILAELKVAQ